MGMLSLIVLGLIIGALAKLIMPGKEPGGVIVTILLGIAGGFLGGYLGSLAGLGTVTGFDIRSLLLALGGSIVLLILYRVFKKKA